MPVTFTKSILALPTARSLNGFTDVVIAVTWQVLSTDGTFYAQRTGTTSVPAPTPEFIPFADLTEGEVWGWFADPQTEDVQNDLIANITDQANPPIVVLPPPWVPANA